MLCEIPEEIFDIIIKNIISSPKYIYNLRSINKTFRKYIDEIKYIKILNLNCEDIFNKLAYSGLYCNFIWLFNNNIKLSINNINNLIINNKINIIKLLFKYNDLKNMLFSINTIHGPNYCDIITLSKSNNPLIICGIYNKKHGLDIIKLLLSGDIENNPYLNQLPGLFEICIKYNNIIVIEYLIKNYYFKIKNHIHKINNLILKSNTNLEDLIEYLIITNKINIDELFICNLIKKKYTGIVKILWGPKKYFKDIKNIISTTVKTKNIEIYNIIKDKYKIEYSFIISILMNNIVDDNNILFINNMINNDLHNINKELSLINLCIKNRINTKDIIKLIELDYIIKIDDIKLSVENKNILLVEKLSIKFNSI